ncbi:LysR family transcriptional regulator [Leucobacter viscericola]|uniref:LysR family transcriptional regulator n=1 Tax=Leucobacter viscericola TaxID=2714935 RepID=A0A6G7XBM2_9MICO|nr:LysR substrate-binding domain-containing protein [Leucobacter viscericola]QIK61807.1 LysR family transcriptional regulator [Leucobacter viscericola]
MNLEQLRSFSEVASIGHFTRAAEQLHLAQPSLSRQIATLEADLGVELFHRARGNITLTSAGERLLPLARRILADADTARGEMAELAGLRRGRIRLGATPTLCTSLVADVLAEFRVRYPGIDIEILERGSRSLIEALMEGSLDLALIVTSVSSGAARAVLEREPVLRESLVVVSASSNPDPFTSMAGSAAEIEDLTELPHIMFPKNYDLRVAVDAALQAHGVHPFVAVEGAEMDAVLRFVERGIGVAIVPAMVAVDRPLLRATPLADSALTRTVSVARRSDMTPTPASTALQALIHEVADKLTTPGAATSELVSRV